MILVKVVKSWIKIVKNAVLFHILVKTAYVIRFFTISPADTAATRVTLCTTPRTYAGLANLGTKHHLHGQVLFLFKEMKTWAIFFQKTNNDNNVFERKRENVKRELKEIEEMDGILRMLQKHQLIWARVWLLLTCFMLVTVNEYYGSDQLILLYYGYANFYKWSLRSSIFIIYIILLWISCHMDNSKHMLVINSYMPISIKNVFLGLC